MAIVPLDLLDSTTSEKEIMGGKGG
ncbi:uncharacterized protein G2W53_011649 [Senna tora]|uniref:Uncharacterized protein n=1 Tax=Senna tora TaxID=362788 RepID=A0A835CDH7_9FABA|nr:uncharacterized protein G2W53_011649 [Senna tora]